MSLDGVLAAKLNWSANAPDSETTSGELRSLEGLHNSVALPPATAGFWKQWRAFTGPAFLISVGYMDPGNWGTDLQAGASYKYGLLWVVALSSMMAIVMQITSARLGIVTGKDLAQACRDFYPAWTRLPNWLFCELAIIACDLAEVLGSAVALNLLFHIPMLWAVLITAFDVLLLLALQGLGMRFIEALILVLVTTIGVCYFIEIFVLPQMHPNFWKLDDRSHRLDLPMRECWSWPLESSVPRSCRTIFIFTRLWFSRGHWHRAADECSSGH